MDDNNLETEDDDDEMVENATIGIISSRDEWLSDYRKQVDVRCQQVDERFSLMEKKLFTVYDLALAKAIPATRHTNNIAFFICSLLLKRLTAGTSPRQPS